MKWISILTFLLLSACASKPTYLKYAGYMEGCATASTEIILIYRDDLTPDMIVSDVDAMCMELYLQKLEAEDVDAPTIRLDRNEMI